MRLIVATVLAVILTGCAGARRNATAFDATFSELSREVAALPPSPQKDRIQVLSDRLERQVIASARRTDVTDKLVDSLTRLGNAMAPAQLELGFATNGKRWSGKSGDDGVEVHLTPYDDVGSAIKTPGTVDARLNRESIIGLGLGATEIEHWTVGLDELPGLWNASLFPAYIIRLPWHGQRPDVSTAILTVTFTPLYGAPITVRKTTEIHQAEPEQPSK